MSIIENVKLLGHLLKYKLTQSKYDLDYCPEGLDPDKFMSARNAVKQIDDSSTVISTGMAAHGRCSIFYWAVRNAFAKKGSPGKLNWITVSAQGGRGKAPGTLDELDLPGLIKEYNCCNVETA